MNNPIKLSLLDHTKPQEDAPCKDVLLQHPQHSFHLSSQKDEEFELPSQELTAPSALDSRRRQPVLPKSPASIKRSWLQCRGNC